MADNYLEKKLEDYRNGRLQSGVNSTYRKPNSQITPRAYVAGGCSEAGRSVIAKLRSYGWKVAFCDDNEKAGRDLAQTTGSQFHPIVELTESAIEKSLQTVVDRWGGVDYIILTVANQAELFRGAHTRYGATLSLLL